MLNHDDPFGLDAQFDHWDLVFMDVCFACDTIALTRLFPLL